MALESTIIDQWLYELFAPDSIIAAGVGSRIYANQIPQDAVKPCLVYIHQAGGGDTNTFSARALSEPAYVVKAVGEGADYATVKAVADRADLLLQNARALFGGYALRCARQMELSYPETESGIEYDHLGGLYKIWISPVTF